MNQEVSPENALYQSFDLPQPEDVIAVIPLGIDTIPHVDNQGDVAVTCIEINTGNFGLNGASKIGLTMADNSIVQDNALWGDYNDIPMGDVKNAILRNYVQPPGPILSRIIRYSSVLPLSMVVGIQSIGYDPYAPTTTSGTRKKRIPFMHFGKQIRVLKTKTDEKRHGVDLHNICKTFVETHIVKDLPQETFEDILKKSAESKAVLKLSKGAHGDHVKIVQDWDELQEELITLSLKSVGLDPTNITSRKTVENEDVYYINQLPGIAVRNKHNAIIQPYITSTLIDGATHCDRYGGIIFLTRNDGVKILHIGGYARVANNGAEIINMTSRDSTTAKPMTSPTEENQLNAQAFQEVAELIGSQLTSLENLNTRFGQPLFKEA